MVVVELLEDVGLELAVVVADASMISSPSRCEAASTRSAIWAGWSLASFGCGTRRRTVGTCPSNGSTLAQSRNVAGGDAARRAAAAAAAAGRRAGRVDADHALPAVEPRELDLVGADEAGALDVDQLPVEHVAA